MGEHWGRGAPPEVSVSNKALAHSGGWLKEVLKQEETKDWNQYMGRWPLPYLLSFTKSFNKSLIYVSYSDSAHPLSVPLAPTNSSPSLLCFSLGLWAGEKWQHLVCIHRSTMATIPHKWVCHLALNASTQQPLQA